MCSFGTALYKHLSIPVLSHLSALAVRKRAEIMIYGIFIDLFDEMHLLCCMFGA